MLSLKRKIMIESKICYTVCQMDDQPSELEVEAIKDIAPKVKHDATSSAYSLASTTSSANSNIFLGEIHLLCLFSFLSIIYTSRGLSFLHYILPSALHTLDRSSHN